jgi:hypothetical protein
VFPCSPSHVPLNNFPLTLYPCSYIPLFLCSHVPTISLTLTPQTFIHPYKHTHTHIHTQGESEYFFQDRSDENIEDEALLRLLSFNNVILTSHQSFLTNEALSAIAQTTLQNVSYALEFGHWGRERDILLPLENNIVRLSSA